MIASRCESFLEGPHGGRAYFVSDELATERYTTLGGTTQQNGLDRVTSRSDSTRPRTRTRSGSRYQSRSTGQPASPNITTSTASSSTTPPRDTTSRSPACHRCTTGCHITLHSDVCFDTRCGPSQLIRRPYSVKRPRRCNSELLTRVRMSALIYLERGGWRANLHSSVASASTESRMGRV